MFNGWMTVLAKNKLLVTFTGKDPADKLAPEVKRIARKGKGK